jgi:hypothetical protein
LIIYFANEDDLIAAEPDLRKILYIQKVRAAQVIVTHRFASPDLARIDDDLYGRAAWPVRIEVERAVNIFEVSTHVSDHHMPGAEFGGGVPRFKSPFSHI